MLSSMPPPLEGPFRINRKSNQSKGLVRWFTPLINLRTMPGGAATEHISSLSPITYVGATPDTIIDSQFGLAYDVGSDVNAGFNFLDLDLEVLTCAAWIKCTGTQNTANVIGGDQTIGTARSFQLRLDANKLQWVVFSAPATLDTIEGATILNDGKWHHIVGTWNSSLIRCFVDGNEDATPVSFAGPMNYETRNWSIGGANRDTLGEYLSRFNGQIFDARIYNRAISDGEVQAMVNPNTIWELYELISSPLVAPAGAPSSLYGPALQVI